LSRHNTLYGGSDALTLAACTAVTAPCRIPLPRTLPTASGGGESIRSNRPHQRSVVNTLTSRLAVDDDGAPPRTFITRVGGIVVIIHSIAIIVLVAALQDDVHNDVLGLVI